MVIDYLIHGRHANGMCFFTSIRGWGTSEEDVVKRVTRYFDTHAEISTWEIEEARRRPILSLFWSGSGHLHSGFAFYTDDDEEELS